MNSLFSSPLVTRVLATGLLSAVLALPACRRTPRAEDIPKREVKASPDRAAEPEKQAAETPTPTPTPAPVAIDESAQVIVLCYHRFEGKNLGYLSIPPETFEEQLKALKDSGISVISMKDFLAWRRGEKNIPPRSAIITIDDGYESGYSVAWPLLKKYDYPFTMFIYTKFVNSGGKSITWGQLAEMRDAGVEIGCHTYSHQDLRSKKGKTPDQYQDWLRQELVQSKDTIENELGVRVATFAYPYGGYNEAARELIKQTGYEAAFTVYGQKLAHSSASDILGRYAIEYAKPEIFQAALHFSGGTAPSDTSMQLAAASMITQPAEGETISDETPEIKANLATLGEVDPKSVQMRISGFGLVPATYDASTKTVRYKVTQKLRPRSYTVILSATAKGKKLETRWSFTFDRNAKAEAAADPALALPPRSKRS